jgi:hypothetical protein
MAENKIALECPNCHWTFEVQRPDRSHLAHSFRKPRGGNVLEQDFVCQNSKCAKPFTVYWFEPLRLIRTM